MNFFYKRIIRVIGCTSLFFCFSVHHALSSETDAIRKEKRAHGASSSSLHKGGAAASKQDEGEWQHSSAAASYSLPEEFADPTTDTAFKQFLSLGIERTD